MSEEITIPDRIKVTAEAKQTIPEAFDAAGRVLSCIGNAWTKPESWSTATSPVNGEAFVELPILSLAQASSAVEAAEKEFHAWAASPLSQRSPAVALAAEFLKDQRAPLARMLAWEIGKTMATATNDVDRCIAGIEWYLENIGPMLEGQRPLGLVSNIASWNYPFSVLLLNVLVQALSGNSVVAKIPAQGGGVSLTLAFALLRRAGLPVTLIGGRGRDLHGPLIGSSLVKAVAFVGGRANGAQIAQQIRGTGKRYALEMEGVNAYVITDFSDWEGLAKQIRTGFDYGKQRCTAYTRWVVERSLVPKFLETYTKAVSALRVGDPFLGKAMDFGPLISADKAEELRSRIADATAHGAEVVFEGKLTDDAFLPNQNKSAYFAPRLLLGLKAPCKLYLREPFGPVDALIPVDSEEQMIKEANVSQGALVASVGTDDPKRGEQIAAQLDTFKVGINKTRSRGDKEELFGGTGSSWEGAFVGGENLVKAFTLGPKLPAGNWPSVGKQATV